MGLIAPPCLLLLLETAPCGDADAEGLCGVRGAWSWGGLSVGVYRNGETALLLALGLAPACVVPAVYATGKLHFEATLEVRPRHGCVAHTTGGVLRTGVFTAFWTSLSGAFLFIRA